MGEQGGATEQSDDGKADPLHGFDLAVFEIQPADLQQGGGHGHACSYINTGQFERDEKQRDREKIHQHLHGLSCSGSNDKAAEFMQ